VHDWFGKSAIRFSGRGGNVSRRGVRPRVKKGRRRKGFVLQRVKNLNWAEPGGGADRGNDWGQEVTAGGEREVKKGNLFDWKQTEGRANNFILEEENAGRKKSKVQYSKKRGKGLTSDWWEGEREKKKRNSIPAASQRRGKLVL